VSPPVDGWAVYLSCYIILGVSFWSGTFGFPNKSSNFLSLVAAFVVVFGGRFRFC